jgi:hypothetical protein
MDRRYADNPLWSYPACGAQRCRSKTKDQTNARSESMGLPSPNDAMHLCVSSTTPFRLGPPPGLCSDGSIVSHDGKRMKTGVSASVGNQALMESMAHLNQAVVKMSRQMDDIMVAIRHLQWAMSVNAVFHPLYC